MLAILAAVRTKSPRTQDAAEIAARRKQIEKERIAREKRAAKRGK